MNDSFPLYDKLYKKAKTTSITDDKIVEAIKFLNILTIEKQENEIKNKDKLVIEDTIDHYEIILVFILHYFLTHQKNIRYPSTIKELFKCEFVDNQSKSGCIFKKSNLPPTVLKMIYHYVEEIKK